MKNRVLILAVMALVSCNKDSSQNWDGLEHFTFEISGKVTDDAGLPLADISVSALGSEAFSRADGTYVLEGSGGKVTCVFVNFSDKDGEDNGGYHIGTSVDVRLDYLKGRHGPYLGLFGKSGVDAVLIPGRIPSIPSVNPNIPLQ